VPPGQLADLYERAEDFRRLAQAQDPGGKFRNAFVEAVFPTLPSSG